MSDEIVEDLIEETLKNETMVKPKPKSKPKKKKVTKFKVYNKTYQNFNLIVNKGIMTLGPRGKNSFIVVDKLTNQIKNLKAQDLLRIVEFRD